MTRPLHAVPGPGRVTTVRVVQTLRVRWTPHGARCPYLGTATPGAAVVVELDGRLQGAWAANSQLVTRIAGFVRTAGAVDIRVEDPEHADQLLEALRLHGVHL